MKRKAFSCVVALFLVAITHTSTFAQNQANDIVKKAAIDQVSTYLNLIPQGQEQEYGFTNRTDFTRVNIGESYAVYFAERKEGVINLLPTHTYRVPVLVNGKSVALLTVKYENGTAEIVDFGATKLAQKLGEFENSYKAPNDRVLVRNVYLKKDFIVADLSSISLVSADGSISINQNANAKIYPIAPGEQAFVLPSSFVAATLQAAVK